MKRCVLVLAVLAGSCGAAGAAEVETLKAPGFGTVAIYPPAGPPQQVVLFLSGDGGWNLGVVAMAERLRDLGALVIGIDVRAFVKSLEAARPCAYPPGALEELSRAVQLRRRLPEYRRPILVGYSSGATLVYAALAAAPPETFAGAISLGFCPDLEIRAPPCRQGGLSFEKKARGVGYDLAPFPGLKVPWMVLQGEADQVCAPAATSAFAAATGAARVFRLPKVGHGFSVGANWEPQFAEAYRAVAAAAAREDRPPLSMPGVEDLGLVEMPASGGSDRGALAVILTGDGGWAEIDKSIGAGLSAAGVPVVGWSSLRYYWTPRTPEGAAADLARIIEHYSVAWKKPRVLLVGYSFGADVLPFLLNRLPKEALARVASVTLLGLSKSATFEFHVSSWLGLDGGKERPTRPELERIAVATTCVRGSEESYSACPQESLAHLRTVTVAGGHHFGGDYSRLVRLIIEPLSAR